MNLLLRPVLFVALLLTLLATAPSARAEEPYEETEKKHGWFSFNKPAKKNPSDQLIHANGLREADRLKKARKAYLALVTTWPGSVEAPIAQFAYAQLLDRAGDYDEAFDEYQELMDKYPGLFPYDETLSRQFWIATYFMNKPKGKFLIFPGFMAPERAVPMLENVVKNAPRGEKAAEAQYLIGRAYELSQQYELAVVAYMVAQQRYPKGQFAEKAAFGRAVCWYRMAEESPNDEEALEQAWAAVVTFVQAFPKADQIDLAMAYRDTLLRRRAEASYNKALYYDKLAKRPDAALQSYRSFVRMFPNSEWTAIAQARIDALSQVVVEKL